MRLISEYIENPVKLITETTEEGKKQYITGPFLQAEVVNRNKRIYPVNILENEVKRFTESHIKRNCAYGELGHPPTPNVNLDRLAIHIKELVKEGNTFTGKALIASTPMGDIVRGLLKDGATLGVSSRALGSLKPIQEGINQVQEDLRLLAIDVVSDPSAPDAYVNGIFEGKEYIWDNANDRFVEQQLTAVKTMSVEQIEASKLKLFENFINSIVKVR